MSLARFWSGEWLLVSVTILAALGWLFSKEALAAMNPFFFLGSRFVLAALVVALMNPQALKALTRIQVRRALVTGTVLGVNLLLWVLGLYHAESMGIGAFLVSLGFLLTPVIGVLLFRVSTHPHTWIALCVATCGLGLLSLSKGFSPSLSDNLFLASAVVFAFYLNFNSRYAANIPSVPLTVIQLTAAGLVTLFASALTEPAPTVEVTSVLGWFAASVLIATSLRFFLLVKAQTTASVAHGAVILTLEPVWTALLGMVWFGERMNHMQLSGCALIFGGLLVNAVGNSLRLRRQLQVITPT